MVASKLQLDFSSYLSRHDLDDGSQGGQGGGGGRPPGTRVLQPPGVDTSGGSGGRPAGTGGSSSGGGASRYGASVAHGYSFENTYRSDEITKTEGKVLHAVLFDHDYNFAGLEFENPVSGNVTSDNIENTKYLPYKVHNDEEFLTANSHTRIVGFRSTKRCREDYTTMSLQPIYYSINENMCKNILKPMTKNLINEVPMYGPECSEVAAYAPHRRGFLVNVANLEQGIEVATEAIVWVCFILILFITAFMAFRCIANRNTAIAEKRVKLSRAI